MHVHNNIKVVDNINYILPPHPTFQVVSMPLINNQCLKIKVNCGKKLVSFSI